MYFFFTDELEGSDSEDDWLPEEEIVEMADLLQQLHQPVHEHTPHVLGVFMNDVARFYAKHKKKSILQDVLNLFKKYLPLNNIAPGSKHLFLLKFNALNPQAGKYVRHYVCGNEECHKYFGINKPDSCDSCESVEIAMFIENPITLQLKNFIENTGFLQYVENYAAIPQKEGIISDFRDGAVYKALVRNPDDFTVIKNVDGFPAGNSTKQQVWSDYDMVMELPPKVRKKFMMLTGIWVSRHKPNMNSFQRPYVTELSKLGTEGFRWRHPRTHEVHISKVLSPLFSVDAQAKAPLQNMRQYNGEEGCGLCEEPGLQIKVGKGDARIYPVNRQVQQRTHERMMAHAAEGTPQVPVHGVKGVSVIALLPQIDIVKAFPPDYQHCTCLGVVKRLLLFCITACNRNSECYFGGARFHIVNGMLTQICPPTTITRAPRSLSMVRDYKAAEYRNWLIYYSIPCLYDVLPQHVIDHWILFVYGIYTLLQEEITLQEIDEAEHVLDLFSLDVPTIYNECELTYNLHQTRHLAEAVRNWGPLHIWSTFPFEDENGMMKQLIHGSNSIAVELANSMDIINGINTLHSFLPEEENNDPIVIQGAPVKGTQVRDEVTQFIVNNEHFIRYELFYRATVKGIHYTSSYYARQQKRDNTLIKYSGDRFGQILYFVKFENGSKSCIIKSVSNDGTPYTNEEAGITLKHICKYSVLNEIMEVRVTDIDCTLVKISDEQFCIPPNMVEVNM